MYYSLMYWPILLSTFFQCTPPMRRPSAAVVNEEDSIFVKDDICIRKFDKTGWPLQDIGFKQFSRPFGK